MRPNFVHSHLLGSGPPPPSRSRLLRLPTGLAPYTHETHKSCARTCGPIVQEVLQGLRPGPASDAFRESFLAIPCVSDPIPSDLYVEAAGIYRHGRRKGVTIRSATDCLIAAIAIRNGIPVWRRDRDFEAIAGFTALETA